MLEAERIIEKRKQDLKKNFLGKFSSRYDLMAVAVIICSAIFRYYYLFKTATQAIWFDEGAYLTIARNFALGTPIFYEPHRDWFVSAIWAAFIKIGLGELFLRFLTVSLGIATLYFFYVLVSHFFNKKIGVISLVFASVLSEPIFWSLRLDVGTYSIFFALVSFVCFFKGIESKKLSLLLTASAFAAFALMAHGAGILIPLFYAVFIILCSKFKFYKSKRFWTCFGFFILVMIPYFIRNLVAFGNIYPRFFSGAISTVGTHTWNIAGSFQYITSIPTVIGIVAFLLFILGLIISYDILLSIDQISAVKKSKEYLGKMFFFIFGLMSLASGMFLVASNTGFYFEPRFIIHFYFAAFVFAAIGLNFIADYVKRYSKTVAILLIIAVIAFASYSQLTYTSNLINLKAQSYQDIKLAGIWLGQNANSQDKIISFETPEIIYYSGLSIIPFPKAVDLLKTMRENKATYVLLWAGIPDQAMIAQQTLMQYNSTIHTVAAFPTTTQPTVVIYKIPLSFYNNSG